MALKAEIADFDMTDIFPMIGKAGKNGVLILEHDGDKILVEFNSGLLRKLSQQRQNRRITFLDHLLNKGCLDLESLAMIRRSLMLRQGEISDLIVDETSLSKEEVIREAFDYVKMNLLDVLCWSHGSYEFAENKTIESREEMELQMEIDGLILMCVHEIDEFRRIHPEITSLNLVIRKNGKSGLDDLNRDVESILRNSDGLKPLNEIARSLDIHPYKAMKITAELISKNAVNVLDAKDKKTPGNDRNASSHMAAEQRAPVPEVWVESFLSNFNTAFKHTLTYPPDHPVLTGMQARMLKLLLDRLQIEPDVTFSINGKNINVNGHELRIFSSSLKNFIAVMVKQGIFSINFQRGIKREDIAKLLQRLASRTKKMQFSKAPGTANYSKNLNKKKSKGKSAQTYSPITIKRIKYYKSGKSSA